MYVKVAELEELARNRVLDTPTNSPCYQRYVSQLNERTALKHLIADFPTAYNTDKVVEQLEELDIHFDNDHYSSNSDAMYKVKDVIDIVKGGGISE